VCLVCRMAGHLVPVGELLRAPPPGPAAPAVAAPSEPTLLDRRLARLRREATVGKARARHDREVRAALALEQALEKAQARRRYRPRTGIPSTAASSTAAATRAAPTQGAAAAQVSSSKGSESSGVARRRRGPYNTKKKRMIAQGLAVPGSKPLAQPSHHHHHQRQQSCVTSDPTWTAEEWLGLRRAVRVAARCGGGTAALTRLCAWLVPRRTADEIETQIASPEFAELAREGVARGVVGTSGGLEVYVSGFFFFFFFLCIFHFGFISL
jgi:hypothetical protein